MDLTPTTIATSTCWVWSPRPNKTMALTRLRTLMQNAQEPLSAYVIPTDDQHQVTRLI